MKSLFADLPNAIKTTNEIIEKCEMYKLASDVLLPAFEIPDEFVVGYGIDFAQRNRNLPFIGKVRFVEDA